MSSPPPQPLPESSTCPTCKTYTLAKPAICDGVYNLGNRNRIFQKCNGNTFQADTPCTYFRWYTNPDPDPEAPSPLRPDLQKSPRRLGIACISTTCQSSTKARVANAQCSWAFCKECCVAAGQTCAVSSHKPRATPTALTTVFPASYARMIAPAYALKLATREHTPSPGPSPGASYRQGLKTTIKVKLWHGNNKPPFCFALMVPPDVWPMFHPQDYTEITDVLGYTCRSYAVLETEAHLLESTAEEDDEWVIRTVPIKVKTDMTLHIRLPGVTSCYRLRSGKRAAEHIDQGSDTPSVNKKTRIAPLRFSDPVVNSDEEEIIQYSPPSSPTPLHSTPPQTTELSAGAQDVLTFPLPFACDMDHLLTELHNLPHQLTAAQKFGTIFGPLGLDFVPSTFSENYRAWRFGDPNILRAAVLAKHTAAGAWGPIVTSYRKGQRKVA